MTWKPDPRTVRTFGPYTMVSERDGDLTAHLVTFPDGRSVRVLPDDRTSGQKRSRVATDALRALGAASDESHGFPLTALVDETDRLLFDPVAYLVGCLAMAGIDSELMSADLSVSIDEWLTEWLEAGGSAAQLLEDLATDGWQIVRKGDE